MKQILAAAFLIITVISSTGYGQAWQQTNGPGGAGIKAVAINSQGHIFVLSNSLMRSTDNGASWLQIGKELMSIPSATLINIIITPSDKFFAFVQDISSNYSLWRSTNEGNSWSKNSKIVPIADTLNEEKNGTIYIIHSTSSFQKTVYDVSTDG